jgi:hypothetical protein
MDANKRKVLKKWILPAAATWIWLSTAGSSFAMDPEGCLTCHQYPGLAKLTVAGTISILHINEAKYRASAHGKFACRKCHTSIEQVPHTGQRQVDCTTECHLTEKEQRLVARYPLEGFHRKEQSAITALQDRSSCRTCHLLYPHRENKMVRALLNLHTGFMLCEVCHLNKDKFPGSFFDWKGAEIADFSGEPFGTFYNPNLKKAHKSEHFISRISVFLPANGEKKSLVNTKDSAEALQFIRADKSLTPQEKEKRLAFFHRDIKRKEISVACNECHSSHSILDFQKLGFDQTTTNNLVNLNIKGLVTKYKTFYFPHLFEN